MTKKRIIFFYEHISREYEAGVRLKKEVEKRNPDFEVYVFSLWFEYGDSLSLLEKHTIDVVIMPWIYHDDDYRYPQPFLEKNKNVYIVNMHHEQIPTKMGEKALLPITENAKNSVLHFAWTELFTQLLIECGVQPQFVFKTGNIRNSNVQKTELDRTEIAEQFNLDINKKWILLAENRGWVLTYNEGLRNDRIRRGFLPDDMDELYESTKESMAATLKEFEEIDDSFFEEYELIYRPHPGSISPEIKNSHIKIIDEYPISIWFKVIYANISVSSTSIFESDSIGIPSFVYHPTEFDNKFMPYGMDRYQKIKKITDINDELVETYHKDIKKFKIFEDYIGRVDVNTIENTSKVIEKIIKDGVEGYEPKPVPYSLQKVENIIKREELTRTLVDSNMSDYTKWPPRSYELINDIPYCSKAVKEINESVGIE